MSLIEKKRMGINEDDLKIVSDDVYRKIGHKKHQTPTQSRLKGTSEGTTE